MAHLSFLLGISGLRRNTCVILYFVLMNTNKPRGNVWDFFLCIYKVSLVQHCPSYPMIFQAHTQEVPRAVVAGPSVVREGEGVEAGDREWPQHNTTAVHHHGPEVRRCCYHDRTSVSFVWGLVMLRVGRGAKSSPQNWFLFWLMVCFQLRCKRLPVQSYQGNWNVITRYFLTRLWSDVYDSSHL